MTALLLTLIPLLPQMIRSGIDIVADVRRAIEAAPQQDRAELDAKWNEIAADVDGALADWENAKKGA